MSQYDRVMVDPRIAVVLRTTATSKIKRLMSECSALFTRSIDNLMVKYSGTEWYVDYKNARRIVNAATQKANLVVEVLSDYDGTPLAGAMVKGTDGVSHFEEMTDMTGKVKRKDIHPELWKFTVSYPNYNGASVHAKIYPGDKEKVLVKLKPVGG